MKKITLSFLLLAVMLFAGVKNVQAEETISDAKKAQIEEILKQITALRAKLQELTVGIETKEEASELIKEVSVGQSGDSVRILQAVLAADASIYPQGLITGYYGPITRDAVRAFQRRNGLTVDGELRGETLKKLKEKAKETKVELEDSENGEKRPCAKVAFGHLIAPGWLRKVGNEKPIVPLCRMIPKGIEKKLSDRPTTTPATTTPSTSTRKLGIESIKVSERGTDSVMISWRTNKQADGTVWYTKTRSEIESGAADKVSEDDLSLTHSFTLDNLEADTTYYYRVVSKDADGKTVQSQIKSFETKELAE